LQDSYRCTEQADEGKEVVMPKMTRKTPIRKLCAVSATMLMTSLAATACASNNTSNTSGSSDTLTVVGWKGAAGQVANMPQINAAFEKAYPNIKLNYKFVPSTNYDAVVGSQLAAGTAPDVVMASKYEMLSWAPQGYLADLSSQPWVPRLEKSLVPYDSENGKTYIEVSELIPVAMFANLTLLNEAGISSAPTNWPEFIQDLQVLKAKKLGGMLLADKGGWTGEQFFLDLGANVVPGGWTAGYDTSKTHWSPTWLPVVNEMEQLLGSGLVNDQLMLGLDPNANGVPLWEAGKYAFTIQGAWDLAAFASTAKFKFTMNPVPGGAAGTQPKAFNFVGTGWAINSHAPDMTNAELYLNFVSKASQESLYLQGEAAFSPFTDVPSPSAPQEAPIMAAFTSGNMSPSAVEAVGNAYDETQIQNQVERMFSSPDTSSQSILAALDQAISPNPGS
jgi:raffinose/stachyose/melibiose transport system substrate-binding protein